MRVTSSEAAF